MTVFSAYSLTAQYLDNTWVLGYSSQLMENDSFGLCKLDFFKNKLKVGEEIDILHRIRTNNTSISTESGELVFYFNGKEIRNGNHDILVNGGGMYVPVNLDLGYDYPQSAVILPYPGLTEHYILITTFVSYSEEIGTVVGDRLLYSVVDMTANNGRGRVMVKNELLLDDNFTTGKLTATRHANGRDWWVVWPFRNSNTFMRFLISPAGITRLEDQTIGSPVRSGLGQAHFSSDGGKYISYNGISFAEGSFLYT